MIYNIPAYVPSVRVYFDNVVIPLMGQAGYAEKMQGITNIATAAAVKSIETFDFASADKMVDLLYKFTTAQWQELEGLFPAISSVIAENASVIERMNTFCGLNMAEAPGWACLLYTSKGRDHRADLRISIDPVQSGLLHV